MVFMYILDLFKDQWSAFDNIAVKATLKTLKPPLFLRFQWNTSKDNIITNYIRRSKPTNPS